MLMFRTFKTKSLMTLKESLASLVPAHFVLLDLTLLITVLPISVTIACIAQFSFKHIL